MLERNAVSQFRIEDTVFAYGFAFPEERTGPANEAEVMVSASITLPYAFSAFSLQEATEPPETDTSSSTPLEARVVPLYEPIFFPLVHSYAISLTSATILSPLIQTAANDGEQRVPVRVTSAAQPEKVKFGAGPRPTTQHHLHGFRRPALHVSVSERLFPRL